MGWDSPEYKRVTIYGPDGKAAYSNDLRVGDLHYDVWAVDTDGVAARAYEVRHDHKIDGWIELLDLRGKPVRKFTTGAYTAQHLKFAPDRSVGYDMVCAGEYRAESRPEDFNVLRPYSRSGQLIGEGVPWSQIAGDYNPQTSLALCLGGKWLFAKSERVGFMHR